MGKDGTQLLRHCVRLLVRVSTDLLAVRLSGKISSVLVWSYIYMHIPCISQAHMPADSVSVSETKDSFHKLYFWPCYTERLV